jgi:hypothetical protein
MEEPPPTEAPADANARSRRRPDEYSKGELVEHLKLAVSVTSKQI